MSNAILVYDRAWLEHFWMGRGRGLCMGGGGDTNVSPTGSAVCIALKASALVRAVSKTQMQLLKNFQNKSNPSRLNAETSTKSGLEKS